MPPQANAGAPITPRRIVDASELRRFETCALAWWYDRHHPLAEASEADLTRRIELFEAVYGPGSRDLPEYQMLTHMRERARGASPEPARRSPPVSPLDSPRPLVTGIVIAALVIAALVAGGLFFAVGQR